MHRALILDYAGQWKAETTYAKLANDQEQQNFRFTQLLATCWSGLIKPTKPGRFTIVLPRKTRVLCFSCCCMRVSIQGLPKPIVATAIDGAAEAIFNIATSRQQRARETAMVWDA